MFVGNFATPTSPTSAAAFATTGVTPQIVIGSSSLLTATDASESGATAGGSGRFMFSSTVQRAISVHSEAGLTATAGTPTNADTRVGTHSVLTLGNTGSVAHQADFVSMDAAGFTLNFTTAATGLLTCLAIGVGNLTSVQGETVQISDGFVGLLSQTLVVGEVVEISDGFASATQTAAMDPGVATGATFQGGAVAGTTTQGGAEDGETVS
jgi:hypothetical protein